MTNEQKLREALQDAQAAIWDAHYGNGIAVEYARSVDAKIREALSQTSDGIPYVAELKFDDHTRIERGVLPTSDEETPVEISALRATARVLLVKGDEYTASLLNQAADTLHARERELAERKRWADEGFVALQENQRLRTELGELQRQLATLPSVSAAPQDCQHCDNSGYTVEDDGRGNPTQVQCEWCYTTPNSKFNRAAAAPQELCTRCRLPLGKALNAFPHVPTEDGHRHEVCPPAPQEGPRGADGRPQFYLPAAPQEGKADEAVNGLVAALQRSLNWLCSYPGGGALNAYDQARKALDDYVNAAPPPATPRGDGGEAHVYYSQRDENGEWQHHRCSAKEAGHLLTEAYKAAPQSGKKEDGA